MSIRPLAMASSTRFLFFTIGYRYDFDFDGKSRCRMPGFYCNDLASNH